MSSTSISTSTQRNFCGARLAYAFRSMADAESRSDTENVVDSHQNFAEFYKRRMYFTSGVSSGDISRALILMVERVGAKPSDSNWTVADLEFAWMKKNCPGFQLLRDPDMPIAVMRLAVHYWRIQWLRSLAAEFATKQG